MTRQLLMSILQDFNQGKMETVDFLRELDELRRANVAAQLSKTEQKEYLEFDVWYADKFDTNFPPRSGPVGVLADLWDQVFKGRYRVSLEQLRKKASMLERLLRRA